MQTQEKRPYYRTKAEWAAAQAQGLRNYARLVRYQSSGGSTVKARRKFAGMAAAHAEALRWDRLAAKFKAQGV